MNRYKIHGDAVYDEHGNLALSLNDEEIDYTVWVVDKFTDLMASVLEADGFWIKNEVGAIREEWLATWVRPDAEDEKENDALNAVLTDALE